MGVSRNPRFFPKGKSRIVSEAATGGEAVARRGKMGTRQRKSEHFFGRARSGRRCRLPKRELQRRRGREATGAVREGAGQLRLMELLEGFVGERGRMEATKVPGINCKTLARAIDSGITPWLCDALERLLSPEEGVAVWRQEGREEHRVDKLEGEVQKLPGGLDAIRAAIEGVGTAQAEAR